MVLISLPFPAKAVSLDFPQREGLCPSRPGCPKRPLDRSNGREDLRLRAVQVHQRESVRDRPWWEVAHSMDGARDVVHSQLQHSVGCVRLTPLSCFVL